MLGLLLVVLVPALYVVIKILHVNIVRVKKFHRNSTVTIRCSEYVDCSKYFACFIFTVAGVYVTIVATKFSRFMVVQTQSTEVFVGFHVLQIFHNFLPIFHFIQINVIKRKQGQTNTCTIKIRVNTTTL